VGFVFLVGSLIAHQAIAATKTASVTANCKSVSMDRFSRFQAGFGTIHNYVTTYDGSSAFPRAQSISGGFVLFSGELRPRAGSPGVYEADYVSADSSGNILDWGTFTANFPTTDADGNGMPDVFQKDRPGNSSFTGTSTSQVTPVSTSAFNGNFSRSQGSSTGSYTVGDGTSIFYNGTLYLIHVSGTATYSRDGSPQMTMNLTFTDHQGVTTVATGSTSFVVNNANQLAFPQFNVVSSQNTTHTIQPMTLNRSGNRYFGPMTLADGELDTTWSDYTSWVMEITDTNDEDSDGIPDLTDAPAVIPPTITTQPQRQTINPGENVTFTTTVTGTAPFSYQWRKNGAEIPGATGSTYSLNSAQPGDSGAYSVRVSNSAGAVTSGNATLTVRQPPVISIQPRSETVLAGVGTTLEVTAKGSSPLFYQWRKNGVDIVGATGTSYAIGSATREDFAKYTVRITNAAGSTTSNEALVRVLIRQNLEKPIRLTNGRIRLRFRDPNGATPEVDQISGFEVWGSADLTNWFRLTGGLEIGNGAIEFEDTTANGVLRRYYRITEQ